jgi:hypothetical protein
MANSMGANVMIGDMEIFIPEDLSGFEMERAAGESDEAFQAAREMYDLIFSAAWSLHSRKQHENP